MGQLPEVNLAEERVEWPTGTRREAISPYMAMTKVIYDPVITTDAVPIGMCIFESHVTDIYVFLDGASTPSVSFTLKYGTDITAAGTELVEAGTTVTTTTVSLKAVDRGWIPKSNVVWLDVTAKSGTVHSMTVILKLRTRI